MKLCLNVLNEVKRETYQKAINSDSADILSMSDKNLRRQPFYLTYHG
jgi:hypothetical protein